MNGSLPPLQDYVVNVVANDYENYELIEKEVLEWAGRERVPATPNAVRGALVAVVKTGLVDSYRFSAASRSYEKAEFDLAKASDLWFYVSAKGKQYLSR